MGPRIAIEFPRIGETNMSPHRQPINDR